MGNRAAAVTALPEHTSSSAMLGPYIHFQRRMRVNMIGWGPKKGVAIKGSQE